MVYDPATNEQIADTYAEVFRDINDFLLEVTAEAILEGKDYDGSIEQWLQFKQTHLKRLTEQATKAADDAFGAVLPAIEGAVEVAYSIGEQTAAAELLSAGVATDVSGGFQTLAEYAIDGLVDGIVNRFQNRVNKLNIVRATQDVYTQVTEAASALVVSGAATLEEAVEIAVDNFLDKGIKSIDLGNRKMALDAYAETSIRTISGNAQVQGSLDRYEDADQYLSWVSDSPMECEQCREWEGKILRTTNDLEKLPEEFRSLPSLEDAKSGGLFHPNCTHSLQVYIDGYSTPPKDTNDEANEKRRNEIRRLQKLERTNKLKEKVYKANGQTNRAKGARDRAARYRAQRRQFEAQIERKSLGWFTGEDRLRRLAEANGIKPEVLNAAKGNLPALTKLAKNTGFDPRLVSPSVRRGVAEVIEPPDISDVLKLAGVDNYDSLPDSIQKELRLKYKNFYESEFGIFNFLEGEGKFHNPPPLPENVLKMNKPQFEKWLKTNGGKYSNSYGTWEWNNKKGKPDFLWSKARETSIWQDEIDLIIAEAEAAGAKKNKKQVVAGGLPSSGKTFTLANKGKDPSLKTYQLDDYVVLNPDDMKTTIIFRDYASASDKKLNTRLSQIFRNDDALVNAGSILTPKHPVMKELKLKHPDIYEEVLNKEFSKSTLKDIREGIASKVPIGDTGLFGYEAANILHEESSAMMAVAQDKVSDAGFNMIHDVTMGSDKPIKLVEDLVTTKQYQPAEVMFIMYSKEQAADTVIDRYIRGNFSLSNGRGGRYVVSGVIDGSVKKIKDPDFANKTLDLLGRPALTDNEVFLVELLESEAVSQNADDIQIINRYSDVNPATGQANAYPVEVIKDRDGKYQILKSTSKSKNIAIDGLVVRKKLIIEPKVVNAGQEDLSEKFLSEVTDVDKKELWEQNSKFGKGGTTKPSLKAYAETYYASKRGFNGNPKVVKVIKTPKYESEFDPAFQRVVFKSGSPKDIVELVDEIQDGELLEQDVILYRGISTEVNPQSKVVTNGIDYNHGHNQTWMLSTEIPKNYDDTAEYTLKKIKTGAKEVIYNGTDDVSINIKKSVKAAKKGTVLKKYERVKSSLEGLTSDNIQQAVNRYVTLLNLPDIPEGTIMQSMLDDEQFTNILNNVLAEQGINVIQEETPEIIRTAQEFADDFIDGELYLAHGVSGAGIYTTTSEEVAKYYATQNKVDSRRGSGAVVIKMKLKAGSKIAGSKAIKEAERIADNYTTSLANKQTLGKLSNEEFEIAMQDWRADVNSILIAQGYQARIPEYSPDLQTQEAKGYLIIFDRSAVEVQENPVFNRADNLIDAPVGERD